jgi:hypothetical protein
MSGKTGSLDERQAKCREKSGLLYERQAKCR